MLSNVKKVGAGLLALVVSSVAMATPPDYSAITAAVDFSTVITGIVATMALLAAVYVAFKGGKLLIRAVRGG